MSVYLPHGCPWCGRQQDAVSSAAGPDIEPSAGDVSICIKCGGIAIYDGLGAFRKPTTEEEADAASQPIVQELRWLILEGHGA